MSHGKFATVINCMDGRTQLPANEWVKKEFNVDYVDTITEAGPDGILSKPGHTMVDNIKKRVLISTNKHFSKTVCIIAHHDCAGHPVSEEKHLSDLKKSMDTIKSWNLSVQVVGLWIGKDWTINKTLK